MMNRTFRLLTVTALLLSAVACSPAPDRSGTPMAAVPVQTVTATLQNTAQPFVTGGVVRARTVAAVTSRIMAQVRTVHVSPGDRVRAGQTLVSLDGRDLQANRSRAAAGEGAARQGEAMAVADRQAASAALDLAAATHKRMTDLRAKNSATQNELDQAVAALRAAESRLKAADARLAAARLEIEAATAASVGASAAADWSTLTAPFDGVVTEKHVEVGNMVAPGQPVVTVEDTRGFRMETRLDESRAALIHVGDTAGVALPLSGRSGETVVQARVAEVARMVSDDTHDFLVKLDLPAEASLRSGVYGRIRFSGPARQTLTIPASALVTRGQLSYVFVVEQDGRAHLRLVDCGEPADGIVDVRSGLAAGDRVVTAPPPALADGTPVTQGAR